MSDGVRESLSGRLLLPASRALRRRHIIIATASMLARRAGIHMLTARGAVASRVRPRPCAPGRVSSTTCMPSWSRSSAAARCGAATTPDGGWPRSPQGLTRCGAPPAGPEAPSPRSSRSLGRAQTHTGAHGYAPEVTLLELARSPAADDLTVQRSSPRSTASAPTSRRWVESDFVADMAARSVGGRRSRA